VDDGIVRSWRVAIAGFAFRCERHYVTIWYFDCDRRPR
jgi:hypothetical protein